MPKRQKNKIQHYDKLHRQHVEKESRRKKLKSARKNLKRNQQSKRVRRNNWLPDETDDWDELDHDTFERVMPRDEGGRRRRLEQAVFEGNGSEVIESKPPQIKGQTGQVLEINQGLCLVETGRQTVRCHIRGALKAKETVYTNTVAVGDEVIITENGAGEGVVEAVLPRRSVLARPDVFHNHRQQIIVANADQLLIVSAWRQPHLWLELVDRYLIVAGRNNLSALICINKADLIDDEADLMQTMQPYRELGYRVILTSALTGEGIASLRAALHHRTTTLSGLSGVGKSSLLRAVQPDLQLRTRTVSEQSGEGRHTTTQATFIRLNQETAVIDTPGIREFGLSGLRRRELGDCFPEIALASPNCRFANCTHLDEPDCAVQAAVFAGAIAASRYHSYQQIYKTLPA